MNELNSISSIVALAAAMIVIGTLCERLSRRTLVPKPILMLVVGAVAAALAPRLGRLPLRSAQQIIGLALVLVLFDGGAQIGWARFRRSAAPILWLGILATAVTSAGLAAVAHFVLGLSTPSALLVGAALAPTDPAVVFSVLGMREIASRCGSILEGEAGANDPVGIALMAAVLAATGSSGFHAFAVGALNFVGQLCIGAMVGVLAAQLIMIFLRRVRLPALQLYPLAVLGLVMATYALTALAHGSGFLAVFVAGILIGDRAAPSLRETLGFHTGVAGLGQLVAFSIIGIILPLKDMARADVIWPGLALVAIMTFVVRPIAVFAILTPLRLTFGERAFLSWSGLKGAVPLLLGSFAVTAGVSNGRHLFALVAFVVIVSVLLQGTLVPLMARLAGIPMQPKAAEHPWSLELRFPEEPPDFEQGVIRIVDAGTTPIPWPEMRLGVIRRTSTVLTVTVLPNTEAPPGGAPTEESHA